MRTKTIGGLLVILLILTARVEASTVSFNPSGTSVGLGQSFTISLIGTGFTDIVDGGGVNLLYDASVLAVNSVTVDATAWDFFDDPGTINNTLGEVSEIQFASFFGATGDFAIATIDFLAVGAGSSTLTLTESVLNPFASGGAPLNPAVTFQSASVTVSAVPLPAAFWMMLSGLGVLRGWLKKTR